MVDKRKLKVWTGSEGSSHPETEPVPLPAKAEVLYTGPNGDGTRKMCGNCGFWALNEECQIHDPLLGVEMHDVCGYHIHGKPAETAPINPMTVSPEESGFVSTAHGVSCDLCRWYTENSPVLGSCGALRDDTDPALPALVDALGACARWEPKEF